MQLKSHQNILSYMDGNEHTITVNYTGATGLTEITIDGDTVLSDARMPNYKEAALGTGNLRIGSFGEYSGYLYKGTATNVVINGVDFPLDEGRTPVYGYSGSSSALTTSNVTGYHWVGWP